MYAYSILMCNLNILVILYFLVLAVCEIISDGVMETSQMKRDTDSLSNHT